MAVYRLTNGYTVTTRHTTGINPIVTEFETRNPAGAVISNVAKTGHEAEAMLRDLCIANALAVGFYGMEPAGQR